LAILFAVVFAASYLGVRMVDHKSLLSAPLYNRATQIYHQQIQDLATEVNLKKTTWTAGHNNRWDYMGKEAIIGQMGVIEDFDTNVKLEEVDEVAANIPDNFDSREAWPKCDSIKEIRDQANCGSCWAFGAVEAMSDRICIASNQTRQDKISAQDLTSCCFTCGMGCNGGQPTMAWYYYRFTGLVSGDKFNDKNWCQSYVLQPCDHHVNGTYGPCPDSAPTPKCTKQCIDEYSTEYKDDKRYAKKVYTISSKVAALQTEIMTNGPVEASFSVYEDFLAYKSGVYQQTTVSFLGGHAVKMLGWGVEDNTPYWLVANSWNEGWGDKGFFKILRGNNECGIEGGCVAGLPKL